MPVANDMAPDNLCKVIPEVLAVQEVPVVPAGLLWPGLEDLAVQVILLILSVLEDPEDLEVLGVHLVPVVQSSQ